ncbi:WD40 repeat-like protein [Piromyces finnis]|uniref:WD40 repeat-like protein n=1 Tax=Piromyces finnis TaxID=1754191 RepID=A0A1Y1VG93_9FUNG|nr:WD40 repeat-like protein [Piromyces finnis]|eukprot:ORX54859.1 WD40 repeat-like protein [Piromyces finnis]
MADSEDFQKIVLKTNFIPSKVIETIYTGGKIQITSDEKYLITSLGEDVNVIDLETNDVVHQLEGNADTVSCFCVRPDNKGLVSAHRSLLLKYWDLETGLIVRSWKAHEAPVIAMDFDPTSTLVATGSADSTIKIWDVEKGYCTHNFRGHSGVISALKFHFMPDKLELYSGSDDCQIRIWDLRKKMCVAALDTHVSVIRGLDVTKDGKYLISGARDKIVSITDLSNYKPVRSFPVFETVEAIGIVDEKYIPLDKRTKDGVYFYTGGEKGIIRIWNFSNGQCIRTQKEGENGTNNQINDIMYCKNSDQIVAVTSDQNILFYNINNFNRTRQIIGYNDEIIGLTTLGENEQYLAVASNSEQVRIYNLDNLDSDILLGHESIVICIDRSYDGKWLVTGSKDSNVFLWDIDMEKPHNERYKLLAECVGHTEAISAVALSRKRNQFILTGSQDRTIKCWDITKLKKNGEEVTRLTSVYTLTAHEKDINSIDVAPNDKLFASGSQDKTAKIWSTADGSLLSTLRGHRRGIWCVKFSPVDQVLATSSSDKTIKIWSLIDSSCLKTFEGHTNSVLQVSFLTSGMQLISSGSDGLVKLWTIKTNSCENTFDNHDDKVWALVPKKDEKYVITGGADSKINIWEDYTKQEIEEKQKANEELILKEQDLSNFIMKKDYKNAIILSMELDQPYRLMKLFSEVLYQKKDPDSVLGLEAVDDVIFNLSNEQLEKLLLYVRDWNTNSKHSTIAQTVLNAILGYYDQETLLKLPKLNEILDSLLPYTERHYKHSEQLMIDSNIIDYTLHSMDLLSSLDLDTNN